MSYRKALIPITLVFMLSSCSITDAVGYILPSSNKPSIEANVAVGKTNVQDKGVVTIKGEDKRQIADEISNTSTTSTTAETITYNQTSLFYLILLILGWVLPSPAEILRGTVKLFKGQLT